MVDHTLSRASRSLTRPVRPILQVLLLCGLLGLLYRWPLMDLVGEWLRNDNYSHGFLVPIFSAYVVRKHWDQLMASPMRGSWLGLPLLLAGIGARIIGHVGAESFITSSSLILVIAGLVLFLMGARAFCVLLFPLLFLLLMVPLPAIVFNAVAFPLQGLAAENAAWALDHLGVPVLLDGNILRLSHYSLGVTEACSGIRSMVSLVTLAIIWAYFAFDTLAPRLILVAAAIPITIAANAARVIVTGLIVQNLGLRYAEGLYHTLLGWLVFLVALAGMFVVQRLIGLARVPFRNAATR